MVNSCKLLHTGPLNLGRNLVFQQDNDPKQTSKVFWGYVNQAKTKLLWNDFPKVLTSTLLKMHAMP